MKQTIKQNIVASKKCQICKTTILIASVKTHRADDLAFKRTGTQNIELPHYCDGGESAFIDAHEFEGLRQKAEAYDNFKEWV